jgi:hypothetical protein
MKSKGLEDHDKLSFQKELKEATPAYVVKVMDEFNRQQKARAKHATAVICRIPGSIWGKYQRT